jgi:hypothetical protein
MKSSDLPVLQKGTNWNVVDDVIGLVRECLGEFEHETLDRIQVPIVDVLHFITYNITTKVIYGDEYL